MDNPINRTPSLEVRYQSILSRIQSATRPNSRSTSCNATVVCIAVSKKQSVDQIESLYRLGHRDFGENYVQELIEKAQELKERGCEDLRWHFIGHLQSNKVKALLPHLYCIHTIDSVSLAAEISKRLENLGIGKPLHAFIQINIDGEGTKSGFLPGSLIEIKHKLGHFKNIDFQGLMCIPSQEDTQSAFIRLRELELQFRPLTHGVLSMGMSDDFETAIREGATHVRIGTAIFGHRAQGDLAL